MKLDAFTVPAVALGVIATVLAVGTIIPERGPSRGVLDHIAAGVPHCPWEDTDSCDPSVRTDYAWETFLAQGGIDLLHVDTKRPFKVAYVGTSDLRPDGMDGADSLIMGEDGNFYVFRVTVQPMSS